MPANTVAAAFTRRHYVAVAYIINRRYRCFEADSSAAHAVDWMADDFCDLFASDNPRFKRGRFLIACGIEA
jgi:hypothetical protein